MTVISFPEHETLNLDQRISQEVRALMGRYAVSQTRLAAWLGLNQTAVSARLRGSTEWKASDLQRVAEGFRVHPAELMGGYATSPRPGGPDGGSALPILLPWHDSNVQPSGSRFVQVNGPRYLLHVA